MLAPPGQQLAGKERGMCDRERGTRNTGIRLMTRPMTRHCNSVTVGQFYRTFTSLENLSIALDEAGEQCEIVASDTTLIAED